MSLLSLSFILSFCGFVAIYWVAPARSRRFLLLAGCLAFYAVWDVRLLALLLAVTVANHAIARRLALPSGPRLALLRLGIVLQCGLLFAFKYFAFFAAGAAALLGATPLVLQIIVPLGLSYYCLKAIALLVDTYRGHGPEDLSLIDHIIYLLFFPSVTAGPIDRPRPLLAQMSPAARPGPGASLGRGGDLLFVGIVKKVVIAGGLTAVSDRAFAGDFASTGAAVLAAVTYSFTIYADFSGYTDIARGLAACLGFDLAVNFRTPYAARSPSEFWQRWHISLSTWLRDYVFLPLGGAFHSRGRAYVNLVITMLIAGLWHGASWLYVLWGLYFGLLLVGHRVLQSPLKRLRRTLRLRGGVRRVAETGLTFALVSAGWLIFRAQSPGQIASALSGGLAVDAQTWRPFLTTAVPLAAACLLIDGLAGGGEPVLLRGARLPWWLKPVVFAAGLYAVLVLGTATQAFIYAQF